MLPRRGRLRPSFAPHGGEACASRRPHRGAGTRAGRLEPAQRRRGPCRRAGVAPHRALERQAGGWRRRAVCGTTSSNGPSARMCPWCSQIARVQKRSSAAWSCPAATTMPPRSRNWRPCCSMASAPEFVVERLECLVEQQHVGRNGLNRRKMKARTHPLRVGGSGGRMRPTQPRALGDVVEALPGIGKRKSGEDREQERFSRPVRMDWSPKPVVSIVLTRPSASAVPSSGGRTPARTRSRVVLPDPLDAHQREPRPGLEPHAHPAKSQELSRIGGSARAPA